MATMIEIELSDELQARLGKVASHMALSLSEAAKYVLAYHLAREERESIDWMGLLKGAKEFLASIMQETKK